MLNENKQKAVIYCRVASSIHGKSNLIAQEARCREYAASEGYELVYVFLDDFSGNVVNRPGINTMLAWLNENRMDEQPIVVLVDDYIRLARNHIVLDTLNKAITKAGGRLKSASPQQSLGENEQALFFTMMASVEKYNQDSRVTWLEKLKSMFGIFRTAAN